MTEFGFKSSWSSDLALLPSRGKDIYFTEDYLRLNASAADRPACFVFSDGDRRYLFPALFRDVAILGGGYSDFETAYGYGGPLSSDDDPSFLEEAERALVECLAERKVIGGFTRFHPVLGNVRLARGAFEVMPDRQTVAIDLTLGVDEMLRTSIHQKHRNAINKARREGLTVEFDHDLCFLDEFRGLYTATMDRLSADDFYYFGDEYFSELRRCFYGRVFLGLARHKGQVVSAALFFVDGPWAHYHLAGSREDALGLSPNTLMLYEAALECGRMGAALLHLGGGLSGREDDGLFRFKARFSPLRFEFNTGRLIVLREAYAEACDRWAAANPEKIGKYGAYTLRYRY